MNLQVINVSGIDCYEKDGVVYLKLETVARGLGFTQEKNGVEYVRWETVDRYLREIGFPQKWGKGFSPEVEKDGFPTSWERPEYIPENVFYRLAMKAKNEAAEAFQAKIADEVIPSIRKTGGYQAKPMTAAQMFAMQAQVNLEQEQRLAALESGQKQIHSAMQTAFSELAAPSAASDNWQDATRNKIRQLCLEHQLNFQTFTGQLYKELEESAHCNLDTRLNNLRKRMKQGGAKYAECQAVSKLTIVSQDVKLREIFTAILQRRAAALAAVKIA